MRVWQSGFELNINASNNEWTTTSGSPTIQTSIVHGGVYAGRINSLASGTRKGWRFDFNTADQNVLYVRFYLYITTAPSAANAIANLSQRSSTTVGLVGIKLNSDRTLQLYDEDGNIGSPSSALNTGQWYCVEFMVDRSAAAGSHIVKARLEETEFASDSTRSISAGFRAIRIGGNWEGEAQTTGDWYLDDLSINDNSGSYQNTYPGRGKIVHLHPNAAGNFNAWTRGGTDSGNNYDQVNEVTPNDATDYVSSNTLDQKDEYNIDNSPSDMQVYGRVLYVGVGTKFAGAGASANASFVSRITAGASTEEASAITPGGTGWAILGTATLPLYPSFANNANYLVPGTTRPYRKSDIDSLQIGQRLSATSTNAAQVTDTWLVLEYDDRIFDPTKGGLAHGEASPTNSEVPVSYQTFDNGAGAVPSISGDQDYGKLSLAVGAEGRSKVYDFGDSNLRQYTISRDLYGTGSGSVTLKIRGSTSSFNQDDSSPSWQTYTAPVQANWRYVQIQVVGA